MGLNWLETGHMRNRSFNQEVVLTSAENRPFGSFIDFSVGYFVTVSDGNPNIGSNPTAIITNIDLGESEYIDMAKGTHVLMYKKAIDGTNLALKEAWNKFLDPSVLEKQNLGYLRLIGEFSKSLMELTINGPSVMAIDDLRKKIENVGINIGVDLNLNNDINDNSSSNSRYNADTDKYDSAHNTIN